MEIFIYKNDFLSFMVTWRNKVDPTLRKYIETMVKEISKQRKAYLQAESPALAQLWIGIGELSKQVVNLNHKLNYLERALADMGKKRKTVAKKATDKKTKTSSIEKSLKKY